MVYGKFSPVPSSGTFSKTSVQTSPPANASKFPSDPSWNTLYEPASATRYSIFWQSVQTLVGPDNTEVGSVKNE